jgi:hypothetical protein
LFEKKEKDQLTKPTVRETNIIFKDGHREQLGDAFSMEVKIQKS